MRLRPAAHRLRAVVSREKRIPALLRLRGKTQGTASRVHRSGNPHGEGVARLFEGPVAAWAAQAAGQDKSCSRNSRNGNARAIAAFREFALWLETELKPRSKGRFAIGKDLFLAKLKAEEMVEISLEELLARGEANLEKDYQAFVKTAKLIDPTNARPRL